MIEGILFLVFQYLCPQLFRLAISFELYINPYTAGVCAPNVTADCQKEKEKSFEHQCVKKKKKKKSSLSAETSSFYHILL